MLEEDKLVQKRQGNVPKPKEEKNFQQLTRGGVSQQVNMPKLPPNKVHFKTVMCSKKCIADSPKGSKCPKYHGVFDYHGQECKQGVHCKD